MQYYHLVNSDLSIQSGKVQQVITALEDFFRGMEEISAKDVTDYFMKQGISQRTVASAKKEMGLKTSKRGNAWYRPGKLPDQKVSAGTDGNAASEEAHISEARMQG